ncbi:MULTISPECIES: FixH family protein [Tritonibacter]|uniref:FixH family protein n=1 Tax=Tritonibacter scottomollicae TaxID=483013 RepID=A0A2T1AMS5_TRISK|nr:FixH family protein [Tritonibacter scottomollicae]PRZ49926.1 nitrogen fixation protein FixH [Tritonibacter scottomollicae]WOI31928.1 FixH family protein [Tritonibacter scottomollicae]
MTTETPAKQREFTGKHMLALCVGCFGIIIAVNIYMAVSAVRTFPGLEVKNSYVASQEFDIRRAAQEALGWSVYASAVGDRVKLEITDRNGAPVEAASLTATLGRATHVKDDQTPAFVFDGDAYVAPAKLAPGNWNIRMVARAEDGTEFSQRVILHVQK